MDKLTALKQYFGHDGFRPGQQALVDGLLAGRDVFGVMPTGGGKSVCYQLPALLRPGVTLVISPLISLMKDQVAALEQAGVPAACLNSSLDAAEMADVMAKARGGAYKLLYIAPERLASPGFRALAAALTIPVVAVDEAHCISQWGQDFRPSYLRITEFVRGLPRRPVVSAFTATATREVRDDILDMLELREPTVVTTGFDRSNLFFAVQTPKDRYGAVRKYLENHPGESGIIYCLTRKNVEEVCQNLIRDGFPVTRYHAGLSDEERRKNQEDFIYDRAPVMVATNAFGMGIDKSNVRFVLHLGMPKNLEAYYQEAGRAGRDGEPAECILYYSGQDVITNQFFIERGQADAGLDPAMRQIIRERDEERLRKMTFYCFTNDCLRAYILRYFGEYGENYCGNCANCLTQFEETDVTEIARTLLECVAACRQRYGVNVILDTVHGANTAKIRNYRMDQSPCYGKLAKVPLYRLRQVMNQLQLLGYLAVTTDDYAIVRLTKDSAKVLTEGQRVVMKLAKEVQHEEKASSASKKRGRKGLPAGQSFGAGEESLFEKLRALRTEIAREEKVPPYIVFSDKTLTHMCIVKPQNRT